MPELEFTKLDPRIRNSRFNGSSVAEYFQQYQKAIAQALTTIDPAHLAAAADLLEKARQNEQTIFVAGNGGSASISEHLCCDFTKGTFIEDMKPLRTHSLTGNSALLTALSNDYSYHQVFSAQLVMLAKPGDVLFAISSSGNSPNIIEALKTARDLRMSTIAITGFSGGHATSVADVSVHVKYENYGVVEDCHQIVMHTLTQYLFNRAESAPCGNT